MEFTKTGYDDYQRSPNAPETSKHQVGDRTFVLAEYPDGKVTIFEERLNVLHRLGSVDDFAFALAICEEFGKF